VKCVNALCPSEGKSIVPADAVWCPTCSQPQTGYIPLQEDRIAATAMVTEGVWTQAEALACWSSTYSISRSSATDLLWGPLQGEPPGSQVRTLCFADGFKAMRLMVYKTRKHCATQEMAAADVVNLLKRPFTAPTKVKRGVATGAPMVAVLKAMFKRCFGTCATNLRGQRKGRRNEVSQHRRGGPAIAARMNLSAFNSTKDWPAGAIAALSDDAFEALLTNTTYFKPAAAPVCSRRGGRGRCGRCPPVYSVYQNFRGSPLPDIA